MASLASLQQAVSALEGELGAAQSAQAALQAQLAAATALVATKRRQLAAAKRALREGEDEALKQLVLAPLFPELASLVFAQLPVDSRLRCREVCRGWRAFLADARHWQVLNLSLSSGVARRTPALLRAAAERARGTLRVLDVSGWFNEDVAEGEDALTHAQLLPILRTNSASLLELRAWKPVESGGGFIAGTKVVERLLAAAPRLRLLECDAGLQAEAARGLLPRLLCEPQFARLRLQTLTLFADNVQPPPDAQALAAWVAMHASLKRLSLYSVRLDSEPVLRTVADLAISQLQRLSLSRCGLSPASLPSLTRMLASTSLTDLRIHNGNAPLLVGAVVPAFCTALRASRLVRLKLEGVRLWELHADGLAIIAACTGHPTLRTLGFQSNDLEHAPGRAAIEAALDALQDSMTWLRLIR